MYADNDRPTYPFLQVHNENLMVLLPVGRPTHAVQGAEAGLHVRKPLIRALIRHPSTRSNMAIADAIFFAYRDARSGQ